MAYKKNVAAPVFFGGLNLSGAPTAGLTWGALVTLDSGAQGGGNGSFTDLGGGQYKYNAADTDLNGDKVGHWYTASGAIPVSFTIMTDVVTANLVQINGATTPVDNIEAQYDTTGLSGETFPATQAQVGNLSTGSAAIHTTTTGVEASTPVVVGTPTNTYTATIPLDGTYHSWAPVGGELEFAYNFNIGPNASPVSVLWHGFAQSINREVAVYARNWVGTSWEQVGTIIGTAAATDQEQTFNMTTAHVNTGANAGDVRIRFVSTGGTIITAFATDQILCGFTITNQSVGYENGAIWLDGSVSNENTTDFVDGVADHPVSTWAAALTLNSSLGLNRFHIANGTSITLTGNSDNYTLMGSAWTLAFGSQSIVNMHVDGAAVSGLSTGSNCNFHDCEIGQVTIGPCTCIDSRFVSNTGGGFTAQTAGTYVFDRCSSGIAGNNTPTFTFPGSGSTFANYRGYSGGIQFEAMTSIDQASVESDGQFIEGTCSGGAVTMRGNQTISGISNITLTDEARYDVDQIGDAVWDEVISSALHNIANSAGQRLRQATALVVANDTAEVSNSPAVNQIQLADGEPSVDGNFDPGIVGIIAGTGIGQCRLILEYEGSTRLATLNRDWKVEPDGTSEYIVNCTDGGLHVNEGLAQGGGASSITLNTLASDANNQYNGQFVFLTSGPGQDQVGRVTAYNGTSKVATVETATNGWVSGQLPTAATGYIMIPMLDVVPTMIGTGGINLGDLGGMSTAMKAEVEAEVTDALVVLNLDHLMKTPVANNADMTVEVPDGTVLSNMMTNSDTSDFSPLTDGLQPSFDLITGPSWNLLTDNLRTISFDLGTPTAIDGAANTISGMISKLADDSAEGGDAFDAETDSLQKLRSGGVQTGSAAALEAIHLDHLLAVNYDPASKPGVATALLNELIVDDGAGVSQYSVSALENAPSGTGSSPAVIAAAVWDKVRADHNDAGSFGETNQSTGSGSGARTVTVTVDDGATVLENATVRFTEGVNTFTGLTNASGIIVFSLDDATYTVSISKTGYSFTPTTKIVNGTEADTYSMTAIVISAPPNAATTTGVMTVYDEEGSVESGVTITVQVIDGPGTAGIGYDSTEWAATSNGSGVVEFAGIILGARYKIWRGTSKPEAQTFTAPTTGTSFDLAEVIGRG